MISFAGFEQYLRFLLEQQKNLVTVRQIQSPGDVADPEASDVAVGPQPCPRIRAVHSEQSALELAAGEPNQ